MNSIIPGILETEWSEIEKKLEAVKPFAKTVHIDIIDGKFSPHTTFLDPEPFKKYSSEFVFELHMMVEDPTQYLEPFAQAGFKRFLGHIEHMNDVVEFVAKGQQLGEVGLALDGPTHIEVLKDINLNDLDALLIFTADKVGESGQEMIEERLQKIRDLEALIPIEVDGGINSETIKKAFEAGATRFITTGYLFEGNPEEQYKKLQEALY